MADRPKCVLPSSAMGIDERTWSNALSEQLVDSSARGEQSHRYWPVAGQEVQQKSVTRKGYRRSSERMGERPRLAPFRESKVVRGVVASSGSSLMRSHLITVNRKDRDARARLRRQRTSIGLCRSADSTAELSVRLDEPPWERYPKTKLASACIDNFGCPGYRNRHSRLHLRLSSLNPTTTRCRAKTKRPRMAPSASPWRLSP
jgi:hypothetical protein